MRKPSKTKYFLFNVAEHPQCWQKIEEFHQTSFFYFPWEQQRAQSGQGEAEQGQIQANFWGIIAQTNGRAQGQPGTRGSASAGTAKQAGKNYSGSQTPGGWSFVRGEGCSGPVEKVAAATGAETQRCGAKIFLSQKTREGVKRGSFGLTGKTKVNSSAAVIESGGGDASLWEIEQGKTDTHSA